MCVSKSRSYYIDRALDLTPRRAVKGGVILGHGAEQKYTSRSSVFSENVRLRWVSPGALSGSEAGGV